jgi:hypothetical protein
MRAPPPPGLRRSRPRILVAFACVAAALALGALAWLARVDPPPAAEPGREAPEARASAAPPSPAPGEPTVSAAPSQAAPEEDPALSAGDGLGGTWAAVDLEEVRAALPENLYWELSAPTTDARTEAWRQAERERWNVEYGKVLSGTASEDEIRAYYEHRQRLSSDYVDFTTYLIEHYGDVIPERDLGLLHLARRLNLARLLELPRREQEAHERKQAQDAAREAWLADEAAFAEPGPAGD